MQAANRTLFALGRDHVLPLIFARITFSAHPRPPMAVWTITSICIAIGLVVLASPVAINAIFSLCAIGIDLSYVPGFIGRLFFSNGPDVRFRSGPFSLGGYYKLMHGFSTIWIILQCSILALPNILPITASNFNWSAPAVGAVLVVASAAYLAFGHKRASRLFRLFTTRSKAHTDYRGPPVPLHIAREEIEVEVGSAADDAKLFDERK